MNTYQNWNSYNQLGYYNPYGFIPYYPQYLYQNPCYFDQEVEGSCDSPETGYKFDASS